MKVEEQSLAISLEVEGKPSSCLLCLDEEKVLSSSLDGEHTSQLYLVLRNKEQRAGLSPSF